MKKLKIEHEGALIVNPRLEVRQIHFVCVMCRRMAIFTNEFKRHPGQHHDCMKCPDCGNEAFYVHSVE